MMKAAAFAALLGCLHAHAFDPQGLEAVRRTLRTAVAEKNPPGVVLYLEHDGEEFTFAHGSRALSPEKEVMTADTVFDAASLTKVVATMPCILILADQGRLDVEAPVQTYLPEFKNEGRELIRVRHLLAHTSVLKPGIPKEPPWSGYEEGILRALASVPEVPPESFFRYSDINFILLGEIVRRVAGEPLDVFARRQVFDPLKMNSTRFLPPEEWWPRIAPTEKDENSVMLRGVVHDPTARRMGGVAGHAGLFTCAEDLAWFARMILNEGELDGARVLKAESVRAMRQVQSAATVFERRGLGWDIDSLFSRPRGEVFPIGSFGHTGFTGTALWIDPFSRSFFILLSSRLHPDGRGDVRPLFEKTGTAVAKCIKGFDFNKAGGALAKRQPDEVPTVLNGVDVLARDGYAALHGMTVGLITNHTGIDARRRSTIDLLAAAPGVKLRALFSPEHGIRGELDQSKISDSVDKKTGLPIHSLYGAARAPTAEQLAKLDALVFDIQDIGCRFYTYISTLRLCLEAAAKAEKKFIVLDRVNPIGGVQVEGPAVVDKESFTTTHAIPIRHGMTVGELALMMNAERALGADLQVIRIDGWQREQLFDQTGLPWINPSPNMRTLEAALLYPGIGLLEFSISVGRGTDTPFQILGAPYVDDLRLAYELHKLGLPGVRFMPVQFTPTASVFKDQRCRGVRVFITDRAALRPVAVGIAVATTLQRLHPKQFALEKVNTLLNCGSSIKDIRSGVNWRTLSSGWMPETEAFLQRRASFLIYGGALMRLRQNP